MVLGTEGFRGAFLIARLMAGSDFFPCRELGVGDKFAGGLYALGVSADEEDWHFASRFGAAEVCGYFAAV